MSENTNQKDPKMANDAQLKARLPKPPSKQSEAPGNAGNSDASKKPAQ